LDFLDLDVRGAAGFGASGFAVKVTVSSSGTGTTANSQIA